MRHFITLLLVFSFSMTIQSQMIRVNGYETALSPKTSAELPEELKKIEHKKYLTQDYKPAYIDDFEEQTFLRYNIYEDQMQFIKGGNLYDLQKEVGRTIRFTDNTVYQVYQLNGKEQFFLIHTSGDYSLLAKHSVRFVEGKKATTGYNKDKPADFKRKKDKLYLMVSGKGLVEVPKKKKDFYKLFGSDSGTVKNYMNKNKLSFKKAKDVKKVVQFLNGLQQK